VCNTPWRVWLIESLRIWRFIFAAEMAGAFFGAYMEHRTSAARLEHEIAQLHSQVQKSPPCTPNPEHLNPSIASCIICLSLAGSYKGE
jgi:hypothetical protein